MPYLRYECSLRKGFTEFLNENKNFQNMASFLIYTLDSCEVGEGSRMDECFSIVNTFVCVLQRAAGDCEILMC
jgi:hypothetical protein